MPMVIPEGPITRELDRVRDRMRRLFNEPFAVDVTLPSFGLRRDDRQWWSPTVEASETPTDYVVTAELPGISQEDVEVQLEEGLLTLRGTKKDERKVDDESRRFHMWEREYGRFERSFRFPSEIDGAKVEATFANGVLTVKVPKVAAAPPTVRTIPISKR